ncbi:hypothetical protein FRB94_005542 [Tulasnella sp. JGI-2019a]|nr:hypothetical protein FRB93_006026 [Tulasnella sp. JGI-2019a]KAG9012607.1 hypothetical protein FRB94_005542 [Tulasnella sp. JGI-2019a]
MTLQGVVTCIGKMAKTATVTVSRQTEHPITRKMIERTKKYLTHDPNDAMRLGDRVVIRNCPPVSARKRFELHQFISRGKVYTLPSASSTTSAQPPPAGSS